MKASRSWMLVVTLLLVASMTSTEVVCSYVDREISVGNTATGYVPSAWTQTTLADFRMGAVSRTDVTAVSDSVVLGVNYMDPGVYALVGGMSKSFYRYNITSNAWTAMAPVPVTLGDGASMVCDGSRYVYALVGGSGTALYRYDVLSNAWTLFATTPGPIGNGGDIAWDGTYLYVMGGATGQQVWMLNLGTGAWTAVTTIPSPVGSGASIIVQNGIMYIARGSGYRTFWQYSISSGTWYVLANSLNNIGAGSDIVVGPGGLLYSSYSNNGRQLESYNINSNKWSSLKSQPIGVGSGGGLSYDGSTMIYSTNGNNQNYFFAYNATLNNWARMTNVPVTVTTGGCLVYVPPVRIGYYSSGTLISATFDTGTVGTRYVQAFWDRTTPSSTTVTVEVRASDTLSAGVPTGSWQSLGMGTSGEMSTLFGRYVQWRVTLTTSSISVTPELQEVRLYYRA